MEKLENEADSIISQVLDEDENLLEGTVCTVKKMEHLLIIPCGLGNISNNILLTNG